MNHKQRIIAQFRHTFRYRNDDALYSAFLGLVMRLYLGGWISEESAQLELDSFVDNRE